MDGGRKGKKEMSDRLKELKKAFMDLEEQQRDAYRRAVWMERHLYDAPTGDAFDTRLDALKKQERLLQELGVAVMSARAHYAAADMAER